MSEKLPKVTMNLPNKPADPMPDRGPRPATGVLAPPWRLLLQIGSENKTTLGVNVREPVVLGRSDGTEDDADVDLNPYGAYQNGVSRRHATVSSDQGALYIEDLESTNGTRINGFQLTPNQKYRLRDGDEVELGRVRMVVRFVRPSS
jgi:pSer/pThr/pTyr-binding forkhead associated (FHA) protein